MIYEHNFAKYPELTNQELEFLQFNSPHKQITEDFHATVVKVSDGDTIRLRTDFRDFDFPLRMLDIDAPEMSEGGKEAKDWLTKKLLGRIVDVRIDLSNRVGKFGRLLGRIFLSGSDVGEEMFYLGLVVPFGRKKEGEVPTSNFFFRSSQWW